MSALLVWPEWRANHDYVEHCCVVLDKRLAESRGEGNSTYRPELLVRYSVAGRDYQVWAYDAAGVYSSGRASKEAVLRQFDVGRE
jgi:hypothetical protein